MDKTYYQLTVKSPEDNRISLLYIDGPTAVAIKEADELLAGGAHSVTIYKVTVTEVMEKRRAER